MKVLMNNKGELALGMKLTVIADEVDTKVEGLTITATSEEDIYWGIKTADDQPFILLPNELVEPRLEVLGNYE